MTTIDWPGREMSLMIHVKTSETYLKCNQTGWIMGHESNKPNQGTHLKKDSKVMVLHASLSPFLHLYWCQRIVQNSTDKSDMHPLYWRHLFWLNQISTRKIKEKKQGEEATLEYWDAPKVFHWERYLLFPFLNPRRSQDRECVWGALSPGCWSQGSVEKQLCVIPSRSITWLGKMDGAPLSLA